MSLTTYMANLAERVTLPNSLIALGIYTLVARTNRNLQHLNTPLAHFVRDMEVRPIAEYTQAANHQHYELPPEFFGLFLGQRRKYSCCLYPTGRETLDEAELHALEETIAHAQLADGQTILELGCGWGALSLFMATRFPQAQIMAVSNSKPQRLYIESQAALLGMNNLRVITADMNDFSTDQTFDRVVSVEMFEHMANWRSLLTRIRSWLNTDGKLFLHVFAHDKQPYRFNHDDQSDWIAQYFFTGGLMPSHDLALAFPDLFQLERDWRWSGHHYAHTARDWLRRYDAQRPEIRLIFKDVYGAEAALWERRWRLFLLATSGLFGYARGKPWGVSHYLMRPIA